jgi:hypothetical protein
VDETISWPLFERQVDKAEAASRKSRTQIRRIEAPPPFPEARPNHLLQHLAVQVLNKVAWLAPCRMH